MPFLSTVPPCASNIHPALFIATSFFQARRVSISLVCTMPTVARKSKNIYGRSRRGKLRAFIIDLTDDFSYFKTMPDVIIIDEAASVSPALVDGSSLIGPPCVGPCLICRMCMNEYTYAQCSECDQWVYMRYA